MELIFLPCWVCHLRLLCQQSWWGCIVLVYTWEWLFLCMKYVKEVWVPEGQIMRHTCHPVLSTRLLLEGKHLHVSFYLDAPVYIWPHICRTSCGFSRVGQKVAITSVPNLSNFHPCHSSLNQGFLNFPLVTRFCPRNFYVT